MLYNIQIISQIYEVVVDAMQARGVVLHLKVVTATIHDILMFAGRQEPRGQKIAEKCCPRCFAIINVLLPLCKLCFVNV